MCVRESSVFFCGWGGGKMLSLYRSVIWCHVAGAGGLTNLVTRVLIVQECSTVRFLRVGGQLNY